ncbi:MAG TPA: glycosyltransferase [Gemmatimonadales bacterium]|jgi:glycosyltransferase involved in cell wall biosynthesis
MTDRHPPWEVVHCVFSVAIGGQEMVILSLAAHANRALFAPRVLCLHSAGELAPRFEALGIPVDVLDQPVGAGASVATIAALRRYLRRRRPAILHTHNPTPHQYGAVARMVTDVPVLVHTKHGRNQLLNLKGRLLERFAGQLTDALVPVSLDAAEVARTVEHVPANRIRVIRNGIDVRAGNPVPQRTGGWRAVHVARLNLVKDQETLLRAARIVADQEPAFHLDIVGDGELRDPLERLASELSLGETVTFHGMQQDIRPFLARADAFVLSSTSEGIALTLLEAMAAGLPVVATDVGGNREVVVPGETGFLVPSGDPAALAGAMTALFSSPARMRRFGDAARRRAVAEFSVESTVAAYEALYLGLLKHVNRTVPQ